MKGKSYRLFGEMCFGQKQSPHPDRKQSPHPDRKQSPHPDPLRRRGRKTRDVRTGQRSVQYFHAFNSSDDSHLDLHSFNKFNNLNTPSHRMNSNVPSGVTPDGTNS